MMNTRHWGNYLTLGAIAAIFLLPVGYLITSVIELGIPDTDVLFAERTWRPLANSLLLGTSVAISATGLGCTLAFVVEKTDVPGRRLLATAMPLPIVLPSFVGAVALVATCGPGGLLPGLVPVSGFAGAFVVLTLLSYPYVYLPVSARLAAGSASTEEAARTLGAGPLQTIVRVVVPLMRNSALGGGLLVFLYVLSDYGAVAILRYNTITQTIFATRNFDRELSLFLGLLLLGVAIIPGIIIRSRAEATSVRSAVRQKRYRLGIWRYPVAAFSLVPFLISVVIPIGVFLIWTGRASETAAYKFSGWSDGVSYLLQPTLNTVAAALAAALLTTLLTLPVAWLMVNRSNSSAMQHSIARWLGVLVSVSFAIPGLVIALALASWALRGPSAIDFLYQSFLLLIIGYAVHFGAQSLQATQAAVAAVPEKYADAAATLGAGPVRRWLRVNIPMLLPGLQAGAGLVLLSTMKELPATLLLAPLGFNTLATEVWSASQEAFFPEAGAASLVLIAVSAVLSWVFILRRHVGHETS